MSALRRYALLLFFVLAFGLTWMVRVPRAAATHGLLPPYRPSPLGPIADAGPAVAALLVAGVLFGRASLAQLLRGVLIWCVGIQWYLFAIFSIPALALLALGVDALLGGAAPDFSRPQGAEAGILRGDIWLTLVPFYLLQSLGNLGEELGWRGFALPRLQARYGALWASLVLGALHALWHLPGFLTEGSFQSRYVPPVPWALSLLSWTILCTWLYNRARHSLVLVTLYHGSLNAGLLYLPSLTTGPSGTRPYTIFVALICVLAAAVVLRAPEFGTQR